MKPKLSRSPSFMHLVVEGSNHIYESYVTFLSTQFRLVAEDFCSSGTTFPTRSLLVGVSCFSFLLPAFFCGSLPLSFAWVLQTIFSFLADFVYFGIPSVFHGIDRVCAITMVSFTVIAALIWFPSDLKIMVPPLFFVCTIFLCKSKVAAKRGEESNYFKSHSAWHFLAGPSAAFVMYIIQK
mmetsp:Transcript_27287/g.44433  ORF Transcript_27287/g.44433 Transcript_27287/m.44433 type:complete len:181 (-) Transcript_27287:575-1117(-)